MSSPSYVAYTPKRHSTQTSISSLSQLHSQHSSSNSSSSSSSSTTTTRPTHSHSYSQSSTHSHNESTTTNNHHHGNGWLKSPQPRLAIPRPPLNNWTSASSSTSTASYSSYSRSPNPPSSFASRVGSPPTSHSHSPIPPNTLPYSPSPRPPTSPSPHTSPQKPQKKVQEYEGGRMPFLREFQPVGVRGDRTEEFLKCRKKGREERKGEELRLERRLDKVRRRSREPSLRNSN